MTTRDPRFREATQSLHIDPSETGEGDDSDDYDDPSASLARGTHEARDSHTKIESPAAQRRTPLPPEPGASGSAGSSGSGSKSSKPARTSGAKHRLRADDPRDYLGQVLGSYRVDELLGKGGMGYVFRAEHVKLGRDVALKLLRADYAKRRDAVARFFQEARTVNRMRHRNIVDVTDYVELDDGTTFIIMELLAGVSLGKWARSGVDLPRALAVLVQICDGLGAAHQVGVIHRDLKPDNVIVVPTSDGAELVKLLDFGVAKLLNRDDEDVGFQTAAGSVIGTPAYMSPEQAGGMAIDHRSDIYSLGAIMYELFCGQPMFRGRSFGEYVRKHLTELPVPPRATEGGRDLDDRLEALILKCLEKEPSQRFQNILELRDGLLYMLGGIETLQSGMYSVHNSVVRVTPVPVSGQVPMAALAPLPSLAQTQMAPMPTPIPMGMPLPMQMQVPMHPAMQTHISSQMHPSQVMGSQIGGPEPRTAWYVWVLGGLVAVGLGIGGAWYVTRGATEAPAPRAATPGEAKAPATPTVAPAPAEPAAAATIEVRFDSLPSAGVFAAGHATELCHTPCAFDVDLKDGGATDKRTFVVRADGYEDKAVVVDLQTAAATARDFHVTLDKLEPGTPTPKPTKPEPIGPIARHPTPSHGVKPGTNQVKPEPVATHPDLEPKPDPKDPKPETKPEKPTPTVIPDRTDTLDPFRKKP